MKMMALLLITFGLLSCGSEQPTGELTACTGLLSVTEDYTDLAWSRNQMMGGKTGQYVRIQQGIIAHEIMLRTVSVGASSVKIGIYKGHLTDTMGEENPPLKEMTITEGLSADDKSEMWMKLPEPFEFKETTPQELAAGLYYFITIEPIGGSLEVWMSSRDPASHLRQGLRESTNSTPPWHPTDTSKALGMGFRGNSICRSSST